jgi:hypothetical protein
MTSHFLIFSIVILFFVVVFFFGCFFDLRNHLTPPRNLPDPGSETLRCGSGVREVAGRENRGMSGGCGDQPADFKSAG